MRELKKKIPDSCKHRGFPGFIVSMNDVKIPFRFWEGNSAVLKAAISEQVKTIKPH